MKNIIFLITFLLGTSHLISQNIEYYEGMQWGMTVNQLKELQGMNSLKIIEIPEKKLSFILNDTVLSEKWAIVISDNYNIETNFTFENKGLVSITTEYTNFKNRDAARQVFETSVAELSGVYGTASSNEFKNKDDLYNGYFTWNSKGEHSYFGIKNKDNKYGLSFNVDPIYRFADLMDAYSHKYFKTPLKKIAFELAFDYSNRKEIREAFFKEGGEIIEDNENVISCEPKNLTLADFKVVFLYADFYQEFGFYKLTLFLESDEYSVERDFYRLVRLYEKRFPDDWMKAKDKGLGISELYIEPYFKNDGFFPQALKLNAVTLAARYQTTFIDVLIAPIYFEDKYGLVVTYQDLSAMNKIENSEEKDLINEL